MSDFYTGNGTSTGRFEMTAAIMGLSARNATVVEMEVGPAYDPHADYVDVVVQGTSKRMPGDVHSEKAGRALALADAFLMLAAHYTAVAEENMA